MPDLDELLALHELDALDADAEARLLERLRADPAARRALVLHTRATAILARTPATAARPQRRRRPAPAAARPPWRWAVAAGLLLAAGLGAALLAPGPAPAWRIASADRIAIIDGPGGRRPARAGAALSVGDTITGAAAIAGPARLDLAAGGSLRLAAGTRFDLAAGSLRVHADHRPAGSPLVFATAHAEATVVGTRFALTATPESTRLEVDEGAVRFAAPGGALTTGAGEAALADARLLGSAPPVTGAEPLPPGAVVRWHPDADADGWYGARERHGPAAWLRGGAPDNHDAREAQVLVRSPVDAAGWTVGPATRLRFAYFATGFPAGGQLRVVLKRADLTNYACDLPAANGAWRTVALTPADGSFAYLRPPGGRLAAGERIHAAAWVGLHDRPMQARLWIRDAIAFDDPPTR